MTEKKLPNGLARLDPLAEIKDAIKEMSFKQKNLYKEYIREARIYTNNELSESEYEQHAMIRLWLHDYDAWQKRTGIEPHELDPKVEDQARKYRSMLVQGMQAYRRERKPKTLDFEECKNLIIEMETAAGGKLELKWSKGPDVIEVEVPRDGKKEEVDADGS